MSKAWAALVTRPSYVPGLLVLHRTLRSVSDYPLVVLVTDSLPKSYHALLVRSGMQVLAIDRLAPEAHGGFDEKFARFADTWTKLQVFGLDQFERLILIDADTIFLRGMDELFDLKLPEDHIAAAPACTCNPFKFPHYPKDWIPANCSFSKQVAPTTLDNVPQPLASAPRVEHLLNSGVVVLHPSKALMEELVHYLNTSPTIADAQFPDQDVLADVFRGRWRVLPRWANALKTLRAVHKPIWDDGEIRLLHYILEKPWSKRPECARPVEVSLPEEVIGNQTRPPLPPALIAAVQNAPEQDSLTNYDTLHSWWWAVYDGVLAELKIVEPEAWRDVDKYVSH